MGQEQVGRSAATRARLLDAAAKEFSAKGFNATSTRDITSSAQISPSALYVHHSSKEELLYLLSKRAHVRALEVVRHARELAPDPAGQLWRMVYDFAVHHAETHVDSRVANYELSSLDGPHLEEVMALRSKITLEFRDVIKQGVVEKVFDPPQIGLAVTAIISQCVDISRWYGESNIDPESIANAFADMSLQSIIAKNE